MYNLENMINVVKAFSEKKDEYNKAQQNIQAEAKRFYGVVKDFMGMVGWPKISCGPLTINNDQIAWQDNVLDRAALNKAYDSFNVIVETRINGLDSAIKQLNDVD